MSWKKYVPEKETIPVVMLLGALGYLLAAKLVPYVVARVAAIIPTTNLGRPAGQ